VVAALVGLPLGPSAALDNLEAVPVAVTDVLAGHTPSGQAIPCVTQPDGVRVCHGDYDGPDGDLRLSSFDGTPLAVYITLPPVPSSGVDGGYPLVVQSHGWGAPPSGPDDPQYGGPTAVQWANDGYAVVQFAARGWGDSCGTPESRAIDPAACANGYIRLVDYRYEVRDVQYAAGLLVDEGIADPTRIGVTGESYGSGTSLALATLKDRVVNADGSLSPWTSPDGTALHIAAAAPVHGWTDMLYALMPNGRTLDSQVTSTSADLSPAGVWKQTIGGGLYTVGALFGYYAPTGTDPEADVTSWFATMGAGEPYDTAEYDYIANLGARYHSPYYLLAGAYGVDRQAPAPLLLTAGFTDAVFPVDEALRYYNLERTLYPTNPIALHFYDGGHQRGQNKPADGALVVSRIEEFFDHYVKGTGPQPSLDVTALTQTCPSSAPSGGPFHADSWEALHPGEVVFDSGPSQTILSSAGDPTIAAAFEPIFGGPACTTASAADQGPGVATYRLPAVTDAGYTLLGAPTVTADLSVTGQYAYVVARLLDVDPTTNTETLIARGVYRTDPNAPNGRQVIPLTPNAWHFAAGHVPKLELLGQDAPFVLASNTSFAISVSNLHLELPVHEATEPAPTDTATVPEAGLSPTDEATAAVAEPVGPSFTG
jgi:hypothetical protein